MANSLITITENDIVNVQIITARELVARANASRLKEDKITAIILAIESLVKSLQTLGVEIENPINVNYKHDRSL